MTDEQYEYFHRFARDVLKIEGQILLELKRMRIAIEKLSPPGSVGKMALKFGEPTSVEQPAIQPPIQGETSMPGKETDTQTIQCTEMETAPDGTPVVLNPANVKWAIDDQTIATLTQNDGSDPTKPAGSATFKAVKPVPPAVNPRTANVTCTDTVTNVVGADTLEVDDSATQPGKMVLTFGTPS